MPHVSKLKAAAVLIGLPILAAWSGHALLQAAQTGWIDGRHGWVSLAKSPGWFWYGVFLHSACVTIGLGGIAMVVFGLLTRHRETARIDAYLRRRAETRDIVSPPRSRPR